MNPWDRKWKRPGFYFNHWYQDAAGGEGYGMGRDIQWAHEVQNASPSASGRIANSIAESTPWVTLTDQDGTTLGPVRYARETLSDFLSTVANAEPQNMAAAFGEEGASLLKNREWIERNNPNQNDGHGLTRFEWFRRGVYLSARAPWWQKAYLAYYDGHVLADARQVFRSLGGRSERGFALLARARNSSHSALNRVRDAWRAALDRKESEAAAVDAGAAAYAAMKPTLYGSRIAKLYAAHTMAPLSNDVSFAKDLAIDGAPQVRQDGQPADVVGKSYENTNLPWLVVCVLIAAYFWK